MRGDAEPGTGSGIKTPRYFKGNATLQADAQRLFAHLDDQASLARHMTRRSLMMGGGRMTYTFDAGRGQEVGSRIRMGGSAFGLTIMVEEVVTVREPPHQKCWQTVGPSRLLIIESYEMGFEIESRGAESMLTVWIAYLPLRRRGLGGRIAAILSAHFARWCVERMLNDAKSLTA